MIKKNKSGIYGIINKINNKIYIGSSTNIKKRKLHHFWELKKGIHFNSHLQEAYNKYGKQNFNFVILELVLKKSIIKKEQFWIDKYKSYDPKKGYNINPNAKMQFHTEESLKKISDGNKLRYKNGRIPFLLGKTHSDETKKILSKLHKGKVLSKKTKLKISIAHKGKRLTDDHKNKIKNAMKFVKRTKSWGDNIGKAQSIKVIQLDLNQKIINKYKSFIEAANINKLSESGISLCVSGKIKQHKGFIWRKDNE